MSYKFQSSSTLLFLKSLGSHFPSLRSIVLIINKLRKTQRQIEKIDKAIYTSNVTALKNIEVEFSKSGQNFHMGDMTYLNEDAIITGHQLAFQNFYKRALDLPTLACISCHKLCFKKNLIELKNMKSPILHEDWSNLIEFVQENNLLNEFVCKNCLKIFRSAKMPAQCILNDLFSPTTPDVIFSLNHFEKILIQRAKIFQVVVKMNTVSGRNHCQNNMIRKVIGKAFHLPLPLEETLKKLPSPQKPIIDHELFILVRSLPTTKKKIWESIVNVNKIYNALIWFKTNNHLYKDIVLPSCDTIQDEIHNMEVEYLECEGNDSHTEVENVPLIESSKDDYVSINKEHGAMLTQKQQDDKYYEHFTIHTLNEPRKNLKATDLFQMLKVNENPIDQRDIELDLKCFPTLYPFGRGGQYVSRPIKISASEFIKSKMMSINSIFRTNSQYLFFLLHESNIRALKAGIYHKLNVSNTKEKLTSSECLKRLENNELEGNLTTWKNDSCFNSVGSSFNVSYYRKRI